MASWSIVVVLLRLRLPLLTRRAPEVPAGVGYRAVDMELSLTTPALLFPAVSLALSVREIQVSVKALDLHLLDLEERP